MLEQIPIDIMKKRIVLSIIATILCCGMISSKHTEQKNVQKTEENLQFSKNISFILEEVKELRRIQDSVFSIQYEMQKKRIEDIDSIRKANAGKGKSEIGIMAQIEDNTNEKFWSSGFTFVAILSFVFGFFTFWFQQKTERHTKNVSVSSQLGVLKDLPRHFYRNMVCTVAMLIKYRHEDNRKGNLFKAYPSEANVMKLQSLPEEFILSIDTAGDDIYKEMHQQKLLIKNYNLEVMVASEHFSRKNIKEESLTNDYDNILYKPIALVRGIHKLYHMLEAYNKHIWWKENVPKLAAWLKKGRIMSEKQADKGEYVCNVITTFVMTHFDKLDFNKIKSDMQKTYFNDINEDKDFKRYIEYNGKRGIDRSMDDLLKLYPAEDNIHFLTKKEIKGQANTEIKHYIDKEKFKKHFFQTYEKILKESREKNVTEKIEKHLLSTILNATDTNTLLQIYELKGKGYDTAIESYFSFWLKEEWEVKELLYNILKIDAIIELPIIGMIEHEG